MVFADGYSVENLRLETNRGPYGELILAISNVQVYGLYKPFIQNSVNLMALTLENRQQEDALLDLNRNLENRIAIQTRELQKSEERLNLVVRGSSDGFWDRPDLLSDEEWWSPQFYQLLGYKEGEIAPTCSNFLGLVHSGEHCALVDAFRGHLENRTPFDTEFRLRMQSGGYRWFRSRGQALWNSSGNPVRMSGSLQDITERKLAEELVKIGNDQLRKLACRLEVTKEEERKQIARELHDEFGQVLTGLKFDLNFLKKQLSQADCWDHNSGPLTQIEEMSTRLDQAIQLVRRLATSLRPSHLDDLGLVAALEWQLQDFEQRTGILGHLDIDANNELTHLDNLVATALFRISQEFLTNVLKHARASQVHFLLREEEHYLTLELQDNGIGIRTIDCQKPEALGILGMQERTSNLGGSFNIIGDPGQGTKITVTMPKVLSPQPVE